MTEGNLVQAGPPDATLLTTVVSLDSMYLYFDSDEQTYLRYSGARRGGGHPGLARRALPGLSRAGQRDRVPHEGRLDFVDNRIDPASGTIRTRAIFSNRDRRFTPGLFARVKLVGSQQRARHCWCATPPSARTRTASSCSSSARATASSTGRSSSAACPTMVSASCARASRPGDKVVVNGLMRVRPGMKVAAEAGRHGAGYVRRRRIRA